MFVTLLVVKVEGKVIVSNCWQLWNMLPMFLTNEVLNESKFIDDKKAPRLISQIENKLQEKYSEYTFYNDFTSYISERKTIACIVAMFYNIDKIGVVGRTEFSEKNTSAFSKSYAQYSTFDLAIVRECFDIIYLLQKWNGFAIIDKKHEKFFVPFIVALAVFSRFHFLSNHLWPHNFQVFRSCLWLFMWSENRASLELTNEA